MNPMFFFSCLPTGLQSRTRMRRRRSIQHPPPRRRHPLRRPRRDHDSFKKSFIPSSTSTSSTSTSSTSATTTSSLPILSILPNIVSVIILSSILSISSISSTPPFTRSLFANGQIVVDNSTSTCHLPLRTPPAQSTTSSNGILLSLRSSPDDPLGPTITSFGFHVDPNGFPSNNDTVRYEVYGLNYEGYYADPMRQEFQLDPLSYDYRGDFVHWTKVASGIIRREDLALDSTTVTVLEADYFQIPFGEVRSEDGGVDVTRVPPLGGVRSFYLTLVPTIAAFQYQEPGEWKLNEAIPLLADDDMGDNHNKTAPSILLGEGTVEYPFPDTPFLYAPKAFVGRVFYEWACPTHAPSVSSAPSGRPTQTSSEGPSGRPSESRRPSGMPSRVISEGPSRSPSDMPTALVVPVSSGLNLALGLKECEEEEDGEEVELSEEERRAVEGAVTVTMGPAAEEAMVVNLEAEVTGVVLACGGRRGRKKREREKGRRKLFDGVIYSAMEGMNGTNWQYLNGTLDHNTQQHQTQQRQQRKLPTASSSLDFSVVITGEYRPLARPGDAAPPSASSSLPDLGNVAEDSINRNSDTFLRELESRTPPGSSALSGVTGVIATNPAGNATSSNPGAVLTDVPTPSPTDVLTAMTPMEEDDSKDTILLIGIIVTGGIMILLASLLFFRHAERKALQNRRKRMERMERRDWEETIGRGFGGNVGGDGANFPSNLGPSLGPSGGGAGLWTETMPTSPGYGNAGPPVPNRYGVPPTTQLPPQGLHPNYNTAFSSPPPHQSFAGGHGHLHGHPSAFALPPAYHSQQQSQLPQQNQQPPLSTSTPQNGNGYSEYYAQGPAESGGSQQHEPQQYSFS